MRLSDSFKQPVSFLSLLVLTLIVAFFAEIQGLVQPSLSNMSKRELFILELVFVLFMLGNRQVCFPAISAMPRVPVLLLSIWLIWSSFSAVNAVFPEHALFFYAEHITLTLFAYMLAALLYSFDDAGKWLLLTVLGGFFLYLIYFFLVYFVAGGYESKIIFAITFDNVGFTNVRYLGYYLTVGAIIATAVAVDDTGRFGKGYLWLGWGCAIAAWSLIFWAGGRGPVLAFAVSFVVMIYLQGGIRKSGNLIKFVVITGLLGALFSLFIPRGYGIFYMLDRFVWWEWGEGVELSVEELKRISTSRVTMWLSCLGDVAANPWLGIGQNNFSYSCGREFQPVNQPHGVHIQAALDWGIPGAVVFFALIADVLRRGYRKVRHFREWRVENTGPFWVLLMLSISSFYDGILVHRFTMMFFVLFLVLSLFPVAHRNLPQRDSQEGKTISGGLVMVVVAILVYISLNSYPVIIETS